MATHVPDLEFTSKLESLVRARYRLIHVRTSEPDRAYRDIATAVNSVAQAQISGGSRTGLRLFQWDCVEGFRDPALKPVREMLPGADGKPSNRPGPPIVDPTAALDKILADDQFFPRQTIVVMHNLDDYFRNPVVSQRLQNLVDADWVPKRGEEPKNRIVIIVTSADAVPEKLRSYVAKIPFGLPKKDALCATVSNVVRDNGLACADDFQSRIAAACQGMTALETENALSLGVVRYRGLTPDVLQLIHDHKAATISDGGILNYVPADRIASINEIGGYEVYKEWLNREVQAMACSELDPAKGCVLVGPPGTGKSAAGMMASRVLGYPLITFNIGAVFGPMVGQSESQMMRAVETITAQNGCVVLLDEADKLLGMAETSINDSTRRVFAYLLSWLSSPHPNTFVIPTCNRTDQLDAALLRAGRFDKIFVTDLPTRHERAEIFSIHFTKRKQDFNALPLTDDNWNVILERTKMYVGAEIEQIVITARKLAYVGRKTVVPNFVDMCAAIAEVTPLSQRDPKAFQSVRDFAAASGGTPVSQSDEEIDDDNSGARGGRLVDLN